MKVNFSGRGLPVVGNLSQAWATATPDPPAPTGAKVLRAHSGKHNALAALPVHEQTGGASVAQSLEELVIHGLG